MQRRTVIVDRIGHGSASSADDWDEAAGSTAAPDGTISALNGRAGPVGPDAGMLYGPKLSAFTQQRGSSVNVTPSSFEALQLWAVSMSISRSSPRIPATSQGNENSRIAGWA
jgi:hypothetical protein